MVLGLLWCNVGFAADEINKNVSYTKTKKWIKNYDQYFKNAGNDQKALKLVRQSFCVAIYSYTKKYPDPVTTNDFNKQTVKSINYMRDAMNKRNCSSADKEGQ